MMFFLKHIIERVGRFFRCPALAPALILGVTLLPALTATFAASVYAQKEAMPDIRYFSILPDVPVMDGFTETEDQALVFDKPGGRIGEVQAVSTIHTPGDAFAYYRAVLPQFGWTFLEGGPRKGYGTFVRENEKLILRLSDSKGQTGVQGTVLAFQILPDS